MRHAIFIAALSLLPYLGQRALAQINVLPAAPAPGLRFTPHTKASSNNIRNDRLYLRRGVVDTATQHRTTQGLSAFAPAAEDTRAIIQLDGPMTPRRRDLLRQAGVKVLGYLPIHAFIVSLTNTDANRLDALGFIRWSADYTRELKLDPDLDRAVFQTPPRQALERGGNVAIQITLFPSENADDIADLLTGRAMGGQVHYRSTYGGSVVLGATVRRIHLDRLAARTDVQYIEHAPELTDRSNIELAWVVQSNQLDTTPLYDAGLTGLGQIVGILDSSIGGLDINHCSFRDDVDNTPGMLHRKVLAYNTSLGSLAHATHVSATVAGHRADSVADDTRGIAFDARIVYSRFPAFDETSAYQALALHHGQGARVHTNSWGDDGPGWYTGLARSIDSFCYDFEDSLVAFAETNQATLRTPENAKNLIAVGASGYPTETPSEQQVASGGAGPTSDGRRKPEIFAPGFATNSARNNTACFTWLQTGTSMACPAIVGTGLLVRQYFTDGYYPTGTAEPLDGFVPTAALMKAILLNSATDMTSVAGFPSDAEGWGRILADNALFFTGDTRQLVVEDIWNATGLSTGQASASGATVASSSEPLKITLVWTEPPASPGAHMVQVNNLDLEVIAPDGSIYLGNVFAGGQSITGGVADDRNNVEQVLIPAPLIGDWTIRVRGRAINVDAQGYALVVTGDVTTAPNPMAIALAPAPALIAPGAPIPVIATVDVGSDELVSSSATLFVRTTGANFDALPMIDEGGGVFSASLPVVFCGQTAEYYVQAQGQATGLVTDPPSAPALFFSTALGQQSVILFDDLETDTGWTAGDPGDTATTGIWQRVDPVASTAQPEDDHSPLGTMCWITSQNSPNTSANSGDVDGGFVTLISPVYDLSQNPDAEISYWRWFYSNHLTPEDTFTVDVSGDGGLNWVNVKTIGDTTIFQTRGGWINNRFRVSDFVTPSSTVQVRFIAADNPIGLNSVEAGVDDLQIDELQCIDVFCLGDGSGDSIVDFNDITSVLSNWTSISAPGAGAPGDANHDGVVNFDDITIVLSNWLVTCP